MGKKSGKRTLAEVLDDDLAAKRKKRQEGDDAARAPATPRMPTTATSKFFHAAGGPPQRSVSDPRGSRRWGRARASEVGAHAASASQPVAGSSGLSRCEKENVVPCEDGDRDYDTDIDEDEDVKRKLPYFFTGYPLSYCIISLDRSHERPADCAWC